MWLIILWSLTAILVSVTIIPMLDTNIWWIRLMDFPRLQIAIAGVAILVAGLFAHGPSRLLVPVLMIAVCGYQAWRIFPYTTFHRLEMELAADAQDSVKILSSNVLMENDRHGNVLDMIARFDPDILFLMETDQRWLDALAPALRRYDTVVS